MKLIPSSHACVWKLFKNYALRVHPESPDPMKPIDFCCGPNDTTLARRRQFLKLSTLFSVAGALPLLQAGARAHAAEPDAPVRIGYLPLTDATPLMVAHQ